MRDKKAKTADRRLVSDRLQAAREKAQAAREASRQQHGHNEGWLHAVPPAAETERQVRAEMARWQASR